MGPRMHIINKYFTFLKYFFKSLRTSWDNLWHYWTSLQSKLESDYTCTEVQNSTTGSIRGTTLLSLLLLLLRHNYWGTTKTQIKHKLITAVL